MPGFLGGSSAGSGGTGGEIQFPKEFVDPVTKLRVSNPANLIDTDFEYGLQPTKWETVELINNTPSFFSKSGDTTIPGLESMVTNAGTREIIVRTALDHGLDVGIPINVQGSKSVTADGAYIINSIPNPTTFTYLCRDNQPQTTSIEDLYTSIITGEFFQGSQLRLSDSEGIVTDGGGFSQLTVTTGSPHGFGLKTPFYFLNLNSTISQEFAAANTEAKSFDSSNSATAQTFDGSNTLSSINIDWTNSATVAGVESTIDNASIADGTITLAHGPEGFTTLPVGTPLYYDVTAAGGYFLTNPRGVVFLAEGSTLGSGSSVIKVSQVPGGGPIPIVSNLAGIFKVANQARTFPGNNIDPTTEVGLDLVKNSAKTFDGANEDGDVVGNPVFDGTSTFVATPASGVADLNWYFNTMVRFNTDGAVPSGLANGETYFVNQSFNIGGTLDYSIRISELPSSTPINIGTNGTGTMTFTKIGISTTKNIIHLKDHGYQAFDMLEYTYPASGNFGADNVLDFYFVQTVYDTHNFDLTFTLGEITPSFQKVGPFDYGAPITPTTINIVGFEAPYLFEVSVGTLPAGLSLDSATGVVSGTPTEVYDNQITITVTDVNGSQGSMDIAFEFTQPPQLYSFTSATFTPGGASGSSGPNISQARSGVGNPSWASTYLNMSTNGIMEWTAPRTGVYEITCHGAAGRAGSSDNTSGGAVLRARVSLTQGAIYKMVVGQRGIDNTGTGAGGGGTFFVTNNNVPILIAGGSSGSTNGISNGEARGQLRTRGGTNGSVASVSQGGRNGGNSNAGPGGGFRSDGQGGGNNRGRAFINGATGGPGQSNSFGGFGGGGTRNGSWGFGAAGGYSGGNANWTGNSYPGGGGGSFVQAGATNVATSTGSWTVDSGTPDATYSGPVSNLGFFNSQADGKIDITLIS